MSVTAETVFNTARTILNDDAISLFSDTVLSPKLYQAHKELQAKLRAADSEVMKNTFVGAVAQNATVLTSVPSDLLEPIKMWEKVSGAVASSYNEMTEKTPLDPADPTGTTASQNWAWKDEVITFRAPSTNGIDVFLYYWRQITVPVVGTDLIGVIFGELYLAPRTAAIMAGSLGDTETYKVATDVANSGFNDILKANKTRLQLPGRP